LDVDLALGLPHELKAVKFTGAIHLDSSALQHYYAAVQNIDTKPGANVMGTVIAESQLVSTVGMPFTLEGKTALVTGGGRGIGRAIAKKLLMSGANVMVNDLDEKMLLESEAEFGQPNRFRHTTGDLTSPDTPEAVVQATLDAFGSIDIIVNNAGYSWDNVIQKTTDEQFKAMLEIHLVTPFRILRAASTFIRESAKKEIANSHRVMRKVVNITSIAGTDGNPGQAGYSSGKAGVIGLTKTLAKEWGRYNVNVNAVGFGLIQTRLVQPLDDAAANMEMHGHQIRLGVQRSLLESVKEACPLGRLGTPEEAAGAVLFFCSPLSDYVTGETLICGGGLHF
jgi:3-oxoacyl-[acyl-carrier protein] reductase